MDLNIVRLIITPKPKSLEAIMPVLKGKGRLFEETLHKLYCCYPGAVCKKCDKSQVCPIPPLTGRQLSFDPEIVRRYQKPGLPYIFEKVSRSDRQPESFLLTLMGTASIHLTILLSVLDELAGVRESCRVVTLDYQNKESALDLSCEGESVNIPILSAKELLAIYSCQFNACKRVRIDIQSPLRIMHNGCELRRFESAQFIRSMLRRISSLFSYYGVFNSYDQFKNLVELAEDVKIVKITASEADGKITARGVTGSFELTGAFDELGSLLRLGCMFHLGKGASYGMGAYNITPIS